MGFAGLAQAQNLPLPEAASPVAAAPPPALPLRQDRSWRLPNGIEEFYLFLARDTGDRMWCERISTAAQRRKINARKGVQVIGWRETCYIEVAQKNRNAALCRGFRSYTVEGLDGSEFNEAYCATNAARGRGLEGLHWLDNNAREPQLLDAQAILKSIGFNERNLLRQEEQGLYEVTVKESWDRFLFSLLGLRGLNEKRDENAYTLLLRRAKILPDMSRTNRPVDNLLRYTGAAVRLPANCYENPTSEFSCRMLECLNSSDLLTCRNLARAQEVVDLRLALEDKCNKAKQTYGDPQCKESVETPFRKVFYGPPETFLPYLSR